MSPFTLQRRWFAPLSTRGPAARVADRRVRLRLECLEERSVPTVFVVNSLADGAPAVDGQLTLREAITAADTNAPSGDAPAGQFSLDTITFAPSLAFGTINLQADQGQLILDGGGDVSIVGPVAGDAGGIAISGSFSNRVVDIRLTAWAVSLDSLTLERGTNVPFGAGLSNYGSNTRLTNVSVSGNTISAGITGSGAGICNAGTLVLDHCDVSDNMALNGGQGGGIFNGFGTLTVRFSMIVHNTSSGAGGGIFNASRGGDATVTIQGSTIAGNSAGDRGGGICNDDTMTVLRSTISDNFSQGGGGIANLDNVPLTLLNCTIARNLATGLGGGGLRIEGGPVTVVNCTIVANTDVSGYPGGAGGIVHVGTKGLLVVANSIVSLNFALPPSGQDLSPGAIDIDHDNFIGGNPQLGPFQDNGGPTLTLAPLPGSPVIEGGTNDYATVTGEPGWPNLVRDQRGARRIINGLHGPTKVVDQGAVEFSPGPVHPLVVGADAGGAPEVRVYDGLTGTLRYDFFPFVITFTGGVRVASGDVNGDGVDDIVAAAGPDPSGVLGPKVKVYDGATGGLIKAFLAYTPSFTGGVSVAVGDVVLDGFADVITGAVTGGGTDIEVFNGLYLSWLNQAVSFASFAAFDPAFTGSVSVAAGDVNGDGYTDVIAGKGPGAAPRVKVFSGLGLSSASQTVLYNFLAYDASFTGGVNVAAADTDGDRKADIITGAGAGGTPVVNIFSGATGLPLASFLAFGAGFTGGVRVGAADFNGDGIADIIAGKGPGGDPAVKVFDGSSRLQLTRFDVWDAAFTAGVFVGGA